MTHNNVFVAILGLLSAFSAFGGEAPSKLDIGLSIGKTACIGGLGCAGLTYCLSKKNISKEDLIVAYGIGFVTFGFGSACVATKNQFQRIDNLPLKQEKNPIQSIISQKAININHSDPFHETKM
jgi:hypothetical protein